MCSLFPHHYNVISNTVGCCPKQSGNGQAPNISLPWFPQTVIKDDKRNYNGLVWLVIPFIIFYHLLQAKSLFMVTAWPIFFVSLECLARGSFRDLRSWIKIWLVLDLSLWKMMEFVSLKNKKCSKMFQTTNQKWTWRIWQSRISKRGREGFS